MLKRRSSQFCAHVLIVGMVLGFSAGWAAAGEGLQDLDPLEQREHLLEHFRQDRVQAIPLLAAALEAETPFVRRTAAHLLVRTGESAREELAAALESEDAEVRAIVVRGMAELGLLPFYAGTVLQDEDRFVRHIVRLILADFPLPEGEAQDAFVAEIEGMYEDAPLSVRKDAVKYLAAVKNPGERAKGFLLQAADDEAEEIRALAYGRLFETVDLETERGRQLLESAMEDDSPEIQDQAHVAKGTYESAEVREMEFQAEWDRRPPPKVDEDALREARETALPSEGWRFRLDRARTGHKEGWFRPDHDDDGWKEVEIETFWHEFLGFRYVGVGWYRRTFDAPAFPDGASVYLHFGAVDESTWVWVNGEYAGHHHIGGVGWNEPFHVEATGLLRPGEENHIAVRAMNTAGAGGIWRPVSLRIVPGGAGE